MAEGQRWTSSAGRAASSAAALALLGCTGLLGLDGLSYDRSVGTASGGLPATPDAGVGGSETGRGSGGESGAPGALGRAGGGAGGVGGAGRPAACVALAQNGGDAPVPSILESVRIVTPDRICGGALMTNSWVLTASSCVDWNRSPQDLCVQYGGAVAALSQVEVAAEMVRHPDNRKLGDGTVLRGRDAMLLRLEHPVVIDGKTTGFHRSPLGFATAALFDFTGPDGFYDPPLCVGWSLNPLYEATPTLLRQDSIPIVRLEHDVVDNTGGHLGDHIWFAKDPVGGWIQTRADVGSGCFVNTGASGSQLHWHRVSIHSANPPLTYAGDPNDYDEAWSLGLGDVNVHEFLDQTLLDSQDVDGFERGSSVTLVARNKDALDAYWIGIDGDLLRRTREDGVWSAPSDRLGQPPSAVLEIEPPAVVRLPSGNTEIWARDTAGQLWTRVMTAGGWGDWSTVPAPGLSSRVSALAWSDQTIHLFALAPNLAVLHAEVSSSWDGTWEDFGKSLGYYLISPPVVTSRLPRTLEVFGRDADSRLSRLYDWDGSWGVDQYLVDVRSTPTAAAWGPERIDVMFLGANGTMMHRWYDDLWVDYGAADTRIIMGSELSVVSREPGSWDVVSRVGDIVRHVRYPR
jgi:hypothetical protein